MRMSITLAVHKTRKLFNQAHTHIRVVPIECNYEWAITDAYVQY